MPVEPGPRPLFGGRDLGVATGPLPQGGGRLCASWFDRGTAVRQGAALLLVLAVVSLVLPVLSAPAHAAGLRLYVHNYPTPPSGPTSAGNAMPMDGTAPTAVTLYDYSTDHPADRPGRYVQDGSTGPSEPRRLHMVNWVYQIPEEMVLSGNAVGGFWISPKDGCAQGGTFHVFLREKASAMSNSGTTLASGTGTIPHFADTAPCQFGLAGVSLPVDTTLEAGTFLELKLTVSNGAPPAAIVAYDTTSYASYLDLPLVVPTPTPEPPTPDPTPSPTPDPTPSPTPDPTPSPTPDPTPTPTPTATPSPPPPTPEPTPEPPTPTPPPPTPEPTPEPPLPTWFPTDPPPTPTPEPTPEPTPTPTPEPTPEPTPTPTANPIPSFRPPVSPHETPPPLGAIETPPPPPPPSPSPSTPPTPISVVPPAGRAPLAPIATPVPRPLDDVDPSRTTDPSDAGGSENEDPPHQLIDLVGGGTGGTPEAEEDGSSALGASLARLASTAGEAVQRFAFPLSLTILVLVFLLVQGEIDRRDPKLAFAPVDSSKDMVYFQ